MTIVTNLCSKIDTLEVKNDVLELALEDLMKISPLSYHSVAGGTGTVQCKYCGSKNSASTTAGPMEHEKDCSWISAQRLLEMCQNDTL